MQVRADVEGVSQGQLALLHIVEDLVSVLDHMWVLRLPASHMRLKSINCFMMDVRTAL